MNRLILLSGFIIIIFLFRRNSNRRWEVTSALWVPLLWMLYCTTNTITYWMNPYTSVYDNISHGDMSGNPIERNFLTVLIFIGVIILAKRKINWAEVLNNNRWLCLFILYTAISILWSDFKGIAVKRWIRGLGEPIMVLVILTELKEKNAVQWIFRRWAAFVTILSVITIKFYPFIGRRFDSHEGTTFWVGITAGKNLLGMVGAVAAIFLIWNILRSNRVEKLYYDIGLLLFALFCLAGSPKVTSKTAMFVFAFALAILLILPLVKNNPKLLHYSIISIIVFGAILQIASAAIFGKSFLEIVITGSGRDMTLTDRTEIWKDMLAVVSKKPLHGVGYASFWIGNNPHGLWDRWLFKPNSGHSGYVDVYVELGLIGIFFVVVIIISTYKKLVNDIYFDYEQAMFMLTLFFMCLLHNVTESGLARSTSFTWFLVVLSILRVPENAKYNATPPETNIDENAQSSAN